MPGPPLGPSYVMTTTSPAIILSPKIAVTASSCDSKTRARPLNFKILSSTPAVLTIQPLRAIFPKSTASPPS